jgi:hypothetical protein
MKDAGDENTFPAGSVEDHVLRLLDPTEARLDVVTGTAKERIAREPIATFLNGTQVALSLCQTPLRKGVTIDFGQVGPGSTGEADLCQLHCPVVG